MTPLENRYEYSGKPFPNGTNQPIKYEPRFFEAELTLESQAFYEIRKQNQIQPYRILDSSEPEKEEIQQFFLQHRDTFFFHFFNEDLVGSILFLNNYIQCLAVHPRYQGQGWGRQLVQFAVNKILAAGHDRVILDLLPGNLKAQKLYKGLGFHR